ncbi:MAG: CPBP family intramembrane glutamic endopeptidase [Vicinamibacterales bacterium]
MKRLLTGVNWKAFAVLLAAGLLGVVAILPFMMELLERSIFGRAAASDVPMPAILALALLQNGVVLAVTILIGLVLSERIGLRMPLIQAWTRGTRASVAQAIVLPALLAGAAVGATLVAIEAVVFLRHLPPAMHPLFAIPLWKRLLAGVLYGGITEELLMRLFLVSLVAWVCGRWWRTPGGLPTSGAFWTAILLVAVLFGLGHLPATSAITPLTTMVVMRALVLNGIAGIAFGYLYWKHGLEAAMLGHMSTHLVMQIPGVILLTRML